MEKQSETFLWTKPGTEHLSHGFGHVVVHVLVFAVLGILFGITISYIFPNKSFETETWWETIFWLLCQLILDSIVIYFIDKLYMQVFDSDDSDEYIGISVFVTILMITQVQIYNRCGKLYQHITGDGLHRPPFK